MARLFAITTTAASLRLDAQGQTDASFTVSNASGRALRGRAEVRATDSAQQAWLRVVGETERQFSAERDAPNRRTGRGASGHRAGKGSFRLDMVSAQNPDDDFAEVPPSPSKCRRRRPNHRFPGGSSSSRRPWW